VAVRAFLERRIAFTDIPRVIENAATCARAVDSTLENVLADDARARTAAERFIADHFEPQQRYQGAS